MQATPRNVRENKNGTRNRLQMTRKLISESIFADSPSITADYRIENCDFDSAMRINYNRFSHHAVLQQIQFDAIRWSQTSLMSALISDVSISPLPVYVCVNVFISRCHSASASMSLRLIYHELIASNFSTVRDTELPSQEMQFAV